MYREIAEIRFYYRNPTLINNLELVPVDAQIEATNWYREAMESRRAIWQYIDDEEEIPIRKLSLVSVITSYSIHYTKLYDLRSSESAPPTRIVGSAAHNGPEYIE